MRGAAKHFNTLTDIENSLTVDKEGTKARLRDLLEGRLRWADKGALAPGAVGQTDATHKIMQVGVSDAGGMSAGKTEAHQFALEDDPSAWLYRLGLTVETANAYLEA